MPADAERDSDAGRTLAPDAERPSDAGRTSSSRAADAKRPCDARTGGAFVYEDFSPGDFRTRDRAFVYELAPAAIVGRTRDGSVCLFAPAAFTGRACDC
jgi:hypothetical protein